MKKILLILISIYSLSFSAGVDLTATEFNTALSGKKCNITTYNNGSGGSTSRITYSYNNGYYYMTSVTQGEYDSTAGTYLGGSNFTFRYSSCGVSETPTNIDCPKGKYFIDSSILYECSAGSVILPYIPLDDNATYTPNEDGSNLEKTCNDTFSDLNGVCVANPSNGYFDEGGNLQCNSPYINSDNSCTLPPNTNENGSCMDGSYKDLLTNTCKPIQTTNNDDGSITTNDDSGVTTDYPTGTNVNYNPETGVTTTTYPDGTSIITYPDGTSSTGGATGSISGTGGGSEDTSGENNIDNGSNDLPSENVANNCTDTNLTLQEKMLCEVNEGMKKQNSESDPTNSLNNLMKDLRDNQMQDNTAMNQNLKDLESLNKDIKAINSSQLSTLNATKTATIVNSGLLNNIDNTLDNLLDSTAENVDNPISTVSDSFDSLTSTFSNLNNTYDSLNSQIYNKYSDVKASIETGFNFTLQSHDIVSCPITKTMNLTSIGINDFDLNIDICYYTSQVKPYLYPILFILFSYGFSISIFNMLRGV